MLLAGCNAAAVSRCLTCEEDGDGPFLLCEIEREEHAREYPEHMLLALAAPEGDGEG